jgi:hypothetical protein
MYAKLEIINPWESNQNISHSVIGELIYNFGLGSVGPGMILIGLLQGLIYNQFLRYRDNPRMVILYSTLVIPIAFFVRGTFHATFGSILYSLIGLVIVLL